MFDSPSANCHGISGVQSLLHRFDNALMFPAAHVAFFARRAFRLQRAGIALCCPIAVERSPILDTCETIAELVVWARRVWR